MSTASPIKTNEQVRLNPIVFFGSTALILVLTAALILYPDSAGALLGRIQAWLSHSFGWYYMLAIGAYLFFVAWVAFSRFGTLKLGEEHEKPDFSYGAWAGMLFSSGSASRCSTSPHPSRSTTSTIHPKAFPAALRRRARRCN